MLFIVFGFGLLGACALFAFLIGANIVNEIYDSWSEENLPKDSEKKEADAE